MVNRIAELLPAGANGKSSIIVSETRDGVLPNQLNDTLAALPDAADREKLEWFYRYCFVDRDMDRAMLGKLLFKPGARYTKGNKKLATPRREYYSSDSIYQLLTGKRMKDGATESVSRMLHAIDAFRQQVQPRVGQSNYIKTRFADEIHEYCRRALKLHRIGNIIGNMSIGKSEVLMELAATDPSWLYTQMPERGHYGEYLRECAEKTGSSGRHNAATLRPLVINRMPEGLIVDDADECFASMTSAWGLATLQFLKHVYDKKRNRQAIVFVWDTFGWAQFIRGDYAHRLGRLWRRRMAPLRVNDVPYPEDLDKFAAAVGLDPAPAKRLKVKLLNKDGSPVLDEKGCEVIHEDSPQRLQNAVCEASGIGVWKMILEDAAEQARERGKDIEWEAVLKAHALFAAMEKRAEPEEEALAQARKGRR